MYEIQYASDLHLEFPANREYINKNPLNPVADILILAGDTLVFENDDNNLINELYNDFLDYLSANFKQVYLLPGNHEFYNGFDINKTLDLFKISVRSNVTYVNNSSVVINNYKFIFSTLWSYLPSSFPVRNFADFYNCRYQENSISIEGYNEAHEISKKYIESEIKINPRQHKIVMVTHHLPSFKLIAPKYMQSRLNKGFASLSESLIYQSNAVYWIYGHSHSNTDMKMIGQTKLVTNPLGYVHYKENDMFDRSKLILLD